MIFKAVIFDYGGVMTTNYDAGAFAENTGKLLGVPASKVSAESQDLLDQLKRGKITDEKFAATLSHRFKAPKAVKPAQLWPLLPGFVADPEMVAFVNELKSRGLKTALLSNVYPLSAKELRAAGCYDAFDQTVLSCEVGLAKPEPEIYQLMLDKLKIPGEECIYIDDQWTGIPPAEALGMTWVLARDREQIQRSVNVLLEVPDIYAAYDW